MDHAYTPRTRTLWPYEWKGIGSYDRWQQSSAYNTDEDARSRALDMLLHNRGIEVRLVRRTITEEITETIEV